MTDKNDMKLLRQGVILPQYRMLLSFLTNVLTSESRVLDLNCRDGYLYEVMDFFFPNMIDYTGVDHDEDVIEEARGKGFSVLFKNSRYSSLKMRENSYDLIVAQHGYFGSGDLLKEVDTIFRASRKWVIFYNMYTIPECDSYKSVDINGVKSHVYGVNYIRETLSLFEPNSVEYSYAFKAEDPSDPIPTIFVIKT